jgi:hypothetical protein
VQIVKARRQRRKDSPQAAAQLSGSVLSDEQLQRLLHSFSQMRGPTNTPSQGVPASRLAKLAIMAGLDITQEVVANLLQRLVRSLASTAVGAVATVGITVCQAVARSRTPIIDLHNRCSQPTYPDVQAEASVTDSDQQVLRGDFCRIIAHFNEGGILQGLSVAS